jgi:sporulation protein YlmC with PRC-barrel domain
MKLAPLFATALLAATPALAQTTTAVPNKFIEVEADMMIAQFGEQADMVKNMNVYNAQGVMIGDVEDVVGFSESQALALAVDFSGDGGYPDRDDVVVPIELVTRDQDKLVLAATPAEVLSMEAYDD